MSKKEITERPQRTAKTVKVSTLITAVLVFAAIAAAYIVGSQTAIQQANHFQSAVEAKATVLVEQLSKDNQ